MIGHTEKPDASEVREMLRAMQAGELTVSRGIELLDMWLAGNYSDDQLPPVRQDLIEEDSMPVEIIDRLRSEREALQRECNRHSAMHEKLVVQRDGLLAALEAILFPIDANDTATCSQIRRLYSKEIDDANAAIASVKGGA